MADCGPQQFSVGEVMDAERRGPNRLKTAVAVLLTCCTFATACGGGTPAPVAQEPTAATEQALDESSSGNSISFAEAVAATDSATRTVADELAGQLISDLGSDERAVDALLLAFDAGHDRDAIVNAIQEQILRGDGSIAGAQPSQPKLGLIEASVKITRSTHFSLRRIQAEPNPISLEKLRGGIFQEQGTKGTEQILILLTSGYTPQQIIEAIIFGEFSGPPEDPAMSEDLAFREQGSGLESRPAPTTEPATADDILDDILDGEQPAVDEGRYRFRGSLAESLGAVEEDGSTIFIDSVDMVVIVAETTTLEGRATFLGQSEEFLGEVDPWCLSLDFDFDQVEALEVTQFSGIVPEFDFRSRANLTGALADGICPGGGPPAAAETSTASYEATLVDLQTLTINIDFDGDIITLIAEISDR